MFLNGFNNTIILYKRVNSLCFATEYLRRLKKFSAFCVEKNGAPTSRGADCNAAFGKSTVLQD